MHPCNSRTGSRQSRSTANAGAAGLQQLAAPLTGSMNQLFATIGQLDHLIDDMQEREPAAPPVNGWLQELRSARHQLEDVLLSHDRMCELVNNLQILMDRHTAPRAPMDLSRCLSRVAYVTRAVVPSRLRIVHHANALPAMRGSASALTQAFISLIAHAARAIDGQGVIRLVSRAAGGVVEIAIHTAPAADAHAAVVLPDRAWRAAVAVLRDHGAEVGLQNEPGAPLCIRVTWPAPALLLA